jgi:hypothetical protein
MMSDIDDRIRGALDADDKQFLESLEGDRGLFRQMGESFHGPLKPWIWLVFILTFIFSGLGLYAIWGFLNADELVSLFRWAALGWAAWTVQIALKGWLWDRVHMVNVLREIKRLELQVAQLNEKQG